jgi:hypothetical protein
MTALSPDVRTPRRKKACRSDAEALIAKVEGGVKERRCLESTSWRLLEVRKLEKMLGGDPVP